MKAIFFLPSQVMRCPLSKSHFDVHQLRNELAVLPHIRNDARFVLASGKNDHENSVTLGDDSRERAHGLMQLAQERHDHLCQALWLFERKAVTGIVDLFDAHAGVGAL
jgi:hypothetical protein